MLDPKDIDNLSLKKLGYSKIQTLMFNTVKGLIDDYFEGLEIIKQQKLEDGEPFNDSLVAPEKLAELKSKPFSFLNIILN